MDFFKREVSEEREGKQGLMKEEGREAFFLAEECWVENGKLWEIFWALCFVLFLFEKAPVVRWWGIR